MDLNIKENFKLWASLARQSGKHSDKDKQALVGIKFEF
jgi:outer membrane autotransporter barrel domain protein